MFKKVFFCLLTLGFLACQSGTFEKEYYDSGALKSKLKVTASKIPNGSYEEYYESGKLKIRTTYSNGKMLDTLFVFYENGGLKEKGLLSNGRKAGWWKNYNAEGTLESLEEYIILKDSVTSYKNQLKIVREGRVDYEKSSFFELAFPDTIMLGKNMGRIDHFSNIKADQKRYLSVIVHNQYSDLEMRNDTFAEFPNSTRIGIFAHQTGEKIISGEIIEKVIDTLHLENDSLELTVKEFRKYFKKKVFVKDSLKS